MWRQEKEGEEELEWEEKLAKNEVEIAQVKNNEDGKFLTNSLSEDCNKKLASFSQVISPNLN